MRRGGESVWECICVMMSAAMCRICIVRACVRYVRDIFVNGGAHPSSVSERICLSLSLSPSVCLCVCVIWSHAPGC